MTYADFMAQVRRQLEETTENVWDDDSLLHWTNEAVKDMARKSKPQRDEQYLTLTVGQSSYELPDYTLSVIACIYDDGNSRYQLIRRDVDELVLWDTGENGTPQEFAVDDENLYLRPAPDGANTIRFWRYRRPAAITATTDTVPFADDYSTAMEYFVLHRAFEQIGDWDAADRYRDRYREAMHDASVQEMVEDNSGISAGPVEVY